MINQLWNGGITGFRMGENCDRIIWMKNELLLIKVLTFWHSTFYLISKHVLNLFMCFCFNRDTQAFTCINTGLLGKAVWLYLKLLKPWILMGTDLREPWLLQLYNWYPVMIFFRFVLYNLFTGWSNWNIFLVSLSFSSNIVWEDKDFVWESNRTVWSVSCKNTWGSVLQVLSRWSTS